MESGVEKGRNGSKETGLTLAGGAAEGAFWVKRNLIGADVPPGRTGEILPGGLAQGHDGPFPNHKRQGPPGIQA